MKKDTCGISIFDILQEKVAEGVDVRVMYDDIGCISKLPLNFASKLEHAGIRVHVFNPLRPLLSLVYNNRDHRKNHCNRWIYCTLRWVQLSR